MDRWKAVEEKNREEKSRRKKIREEKELEDVRRKKLQVREKVGKSRNTIFTTYKIDDFFLLGTYILCMYFCKELHFFYIWGYIEWASALVLPTPLFGGSC